MEINEANIIQVLRWRSLKEACHILGEFMPVNDAADYLERLLAEEKICLMDIGINKVIETGGILPNDEFEAF